jgi:hypothetical protein
MRRDSSELIIDMTVQVKIIRSIDVYVNVR